MSICVYSDFVKVVSVDGLLLRLEDGHSCSLERLESICDQMGYEIKELKDVNDFNFLKGQSVRFRIIDGEIINIQLRNVLLKVEK